VTQIAVGISDVITIQLAEAEAVMMNSDITGYAAATAQEYAARNAGFLSAHNIGVGVSQIWIDPGSRVVFVTVTADLSSLLPGFLAHRGRYNATGYARTRMQGNP
jgi:hypothetical protein